MDTTTRQLLSLITGAMGIEEISESDYHNADWNQIFSLAQIHNIVPMVYEVVQNLSSFRLYQTELSSLWRKLAISSSLGQMYKTMEFIKIYEKLTQAGIKALVVKGIICRELYPNHYYRSSGDEDIYIRKSDYQQADRIFQTIGLTRDKGKFHVEAPDQVTTYRDIKSGLVIELHTELFPVETSLLKEMNQFFNYAFEEAQVVEIEGVKMHTMSCDSHLLFLILHCVKHFLATGFGIRQVCDLVMFINTFGEKVDWHKIWGPVGYLGYEVFLINLLDIGIKYLGLKPDKIGFSKQWSEAETQSDSLLMDILEAGIFGKSTIGQIKTSSMTLSVASNKKKQRGSRSRRSIFLQSIFPGREYMSSHYSYCKKCPLLLPVAWVHRMVVYAVETRNLKDMIHTVYNSLSIGRRRIELLHKYHMVNNQKGRIKE